MATRILVKLDVAAKVVMGLLSCAVENTKHFLLLLFKILGF